MKKALVVGGSNGIGLAVSIKLINKGYHVYILDISEPDLCVVDTLSKKNYTYIYSNLLFFDESLFSSLKDLDDLDFLFISAGFGRVTDFENLHIKEIENIISVNTLSVIKIINIFYPRILSEKKFFCGVMGSIAGLVSSPAFSVYAASKAAVCRFTESVNIELEAKHYDNRILNISPGSLKGTKFNGDKYNDISQLNDLSTEIINRIFESRELFVPQYNEIYKDVIERYRLDSHKFGLESYEYKKTRKTDNRNIKIGYLSGTFDLFHIGHLNLLQRAKKCCDYLIVGVHPDASHKGKEVFIPFDERKKIVESCKYVDKVVDSCLEDSEAWLKYHYNILFVGSDYKGTERFKAYEEYFKDKNVQIIYFPYTKGTSSTKLREQIETNK